MITGGLTFLVLQVSLGVSVGPPPSWNKSATLGKDLSESAICQLLCTCLINFSNKSLLKSAGSHVIGKIKLSMQFRLAISLYAMLHQDL